MTERFNKFIEENYDTQNTKNEQKKDLCITSEQLTEQWKKGELPSGFYYIKRGLSKRIDMSYLGGALFEGNIEVIELVPTFEEWKASEKYNKHLEEVIKVYERKDKQATETSIAYNELLEENEKLKELLNKAFKYVHQDCLKNLRVGYTPRSALLTKDIIEALKDYRRKNATEFIYVEDNKDD